MLIAAAFCMFNRYVDGLATWAPQEPESYRARPDDRGQGLWRHPHRRDLRARDVGLVWHWLGVDDGGDPAPTTLWEPLRALLV